MAEIAIKVKHQGKVHDLEVDVENGTGEDLKVQLYSLTGVEPDYQKIVAKKMVKDDTLLKSLGLKPGQTITLIGNPSDKVVIDAPTEKMKFAEDMTEAELAQQEGAIPAGLQNMGNTCYANATLQTLRAVPELIEELRVYKPAAPTAGPSSSLFSAEQLAQHGLGGLSGGSDLTSALGDLFQQMNETQQGFPPLMFLTALRQKHPQFAERAKNGHGYAQQDAEEVWSQLVQNLRDTLKLKDDPNGYKTWVDKYMGGKFDVTTTCKEAPDEGVSTNSEDFNDLKCNINVEVNHMREGISIALNEELEKNSPSLGRTAIYARQSKISRLPKYLPIHFVRFFWRKDTGKKAKILRKVTFQHEIDVTEFCTDELRKKLIPVRDHIREVRKEEEDVVRAKKRQKRINQQIEDASKDAKVRGDEPLQKKLQKEKERESKATGPDSEAELVQQKKSNSAQKDTAMGGTEEEEVYKTDEQIEQERAASILASKKELLKLVHPDLAKDPASNQTGLYELRGVVTHQGSSADSGHYTAYVKKTAAPGKEEDGKWWWFNDDKVQEVDSEKIETLSGGGETHSALILLYRAVPLPEV